jgi:hypothetical protein
MSNQNLTEELKGEMDKIRMYDTHEHIRRRTDLLAEGGNLFTSLKYSLVCMDFLSAGMSPDYWTNNSNQEENWNRMKPYIKNVKTANYYRTLFQITYKDLYGFDHEELNDDNWRELSDKIHKAYTKEDFYASVFKKMNVEVALLDPFWDPGYVAEDNNLFLPAPGMDPFIFVRSGKTRVSNPGGFNIPWWNENPLRHLLKKWGIGYETFDDFLGLIDMAFNKLKQDNGVGIKFRVGYSRYLSVDRVSKPEAEKIFYIDEDEITPPQIKRLEDFIIRSIIQKAIEYRVPIQIHTGLQGTLGGHPQYSDPLQLTNIFRDYPQAQFIIFHGSYPWASEAAVLAKGYPNVYLELCWLSWLLEDAAKQYMKEWLAMVPVSKIFMGGDSETIDRAYTAITLAKKLLAEVLADKIEAGHYSKSTAVDIAKMIFNENPKSMYKL